MPRVQSPPIPMSTKLIQTGCTSSAAPMKVFDVIVIGGGLSGVLLSHGIHHHNHQQPKPEWQLLEARSVLGGRLSNDAAGRKIDMGGAWIWPQHQPRVRKLVKELDLPTFPQPDDPSSTRIEGGAVRLVEALSKDLPSDCIQYNTAVKSCTLLSPGDKNNHTPTPLVKLTTTKDQIWWARRVVWAIPPRLLHERVTFDPPLSALKQQELAAAHTWMAGVTKIALVYDNRFWSRQASNMGLPSHLGPAFQVYDSSTKDEKNVSALTFFTLANVEKDDATLATEVAQQMEKVWSYVGEKEAAQKIHSFNELYVQRWPQETYISEDPCPQQIHPHPQVELDLSTPEWGGLLQFAGSETDRLSPGVMEGAIGAAQRVLQTLQDIWKQEATDVKACVMADAAAT